MTTTPTTQAQIDALIGKQNNLIKMFPDTKGITFDTQDIQKLLTLCKSIKDLREGLENLIEEAYCLHNLSEHEFGTGLWQANEKILKAEQTLQKNDELLSTLFPF